MRRDVITDLDDTQQRVVRPNASTTSRLDHLWVTNPADAPVYIHLWDDSAVTGSPALDIADVTDQVLVASGFSGIVYLGLGISGSVVISASTAAAGTGAPSDALAVSLRWE